MSHPNITNVTKFELVSPQVDDGFLRLANVLLEEFIIRDFSKRQYKILLFILRLSWACNKKYAVIPNLKDFELCGISKNNIKKELLELENAGVLYWNRSENIFALNKYYEYWKTPKVLKIRTGQNIRQLIKANLTVLKIRTEDFEKFLKQEPPVLKMITSWFLKQELFESYKSDIEPEKDPPKTNLKQVKEKVVATIKIKSEEVKCIIERENIDINKRVYKQYSIEQIESAILYTNERNPESFERYLIDCLKKGYYKDKKSLPISVGEFTHEELKHLADIYETSIEEIQQRIPKDRDRFIKVLERDRIR